ncbi:hypothetical protein ACIDI_3c00240 [Acidiphilium sp. JA12-A1]|nr:hypothetical protein ACIDI_3c00240 [Acidiphilium sp. JA12-A1]
MQGTVRSSAADNHPGSYPTQQGGFRSQSSHKTQHDAARVLSAG